MNKGSKLEKAPTQRLDRGRQTNVIDRPRDKTTDAGESLEWGKGHGDKYGQRIASIMMEIMDLGSDKKVRFKIHQ